MSFLCSQKAAKPFYAHQSLAPEIQFYTGNNRLVLEIPFSDSAFLKTKTGIVYLNYYGETKMRWFKDFEHFPVLSIMNILNAEYRDPEMIKVFKDKIVFIGSTALGAYASRHAPVDSALPGIFFHMNIVRLLLDGHFFVSDNT